MFSNNIATYEVLFVLLIFFGLLLAAGFMLSNELGRKTRLENRIGLITGTKKQEIEEADLKPQGPLALRMVSGFGMFIARSGLLNSQTLVQMQATLEGIGFRGGKGLGLFIGAKILLLLVSPLIGFLIADHFGASRISTLMFMAGGAIVGMLAPEFIATRIRNKHLARVEAGVPDALDMLVICADAGLALEAGITRVAQELEVLNPQLGMELTQTAREMQIGSDMRAAMDSLGQRTGLETLKRLATTLAQSLQFGTPLTAALRSLSAELRQEALVKFEERAGKLPTMMTLPMIIFILPCVFFIVAGPAIIQVMATFKGSK